MPIRLAEMVVLEDCGGTSVTTTVSFAPTEETVVEVVVLVVVEVVVVEVVEVARMFPGVACNCRLAKLVHCRTASSSVL